MPPQTPLTSWLVVGCGYTGTLLVRALVALDAAVTITRRDAGDAAAQAAELGVRGARADLRDPSSLAGLVEDGAIVVCLAPPADDPGAEIRALVAAAARAARLVYVSSTAVYPSANGEWVDESWPTGPTTTAGRARVAAEHALAEAAIPWLSLRVAGIHGPGRGLVDRIRSGTYRVIGDGLAHISRIHVYDLVSALIAAGTGTATGVINIADDDPAPIGAVADAVATALGLARPPRIPADVVSPEVAGMLTADRRIVNHRMKRELGVVLRYPSWRDALS